MATAPTPPSPTPPDEPAQPAVPPNADDDRGYEVPKRTWLIHGSIIVAFALFLSMVALIYTRWANSKDPNTTLVLYGDSRFDGIEVTIDGARLDAPVVKRFNPDDRYQVRVPLPAGTYLVHITKNGAPLVGDTTIFMREGIGQEYDLTHAVKSLGPPPTQPTTAP